MTFSYRKGVRLKLKSAELYKRVCELAEQCSSGVRVTPHNYLTEIVEVMCVERGIPLTSMRNKEQIDGIVEQWLNENRHPVHGSTRYPLVRYDVHAGCADINEDYSIGEEVTHSSAYTSLAVMA